MKKVLIITYYWPPSGGAGVQRWLKFVKYLREYNIEPTVYTVENGEFPENDNSLLKDIPEGIAVLKRPIWEPYDLYKKFIGQKRGDKIQTAFLTEKKKPSLAEKIAVWLRGNIFIPDARKFWIKPSVNYLCNYLSAHPVDAIISTGPPHSMHMIALGLKRKLNIRWVADFRDPWTNIDYYSDLMLSKYADRKHHELEREVITSADRVIVIGKTMGEEFSSQFKRKIDVITNGYDAEDVNDNTVELDKKFSIAHVGTMVKTRNPLVLWDALKMLMEEVRELKNDLEIKLVGKVDLSVQQSIKDCGLENFVKRTDYLPHNEVAKIQSQSQLLLLVVNNTNNAKGILTGKLFEYLLAKRPVICIGPTDGDAASIIEETQAGEVVGFVDTLKMKTVLLHYYNLYKQNNLKSNSIGIEKYSRKNLTKKLADILNKL